MVYLVIWKRHFRYPTISPLIFLPCSYSQISRCTLILNINCLHPFHALWKAHLLCPPFVGELEVPWNLHSPWSSFLAPSSGQLSAVTYYLQNSPVELIQSYLLYDFHWYHPLTRPPSSSFYLPTPFNFFFQEQSLISHFIWIVVLIVSL